MTAQQATQILTDEAMRQGADANDSQGIVRALVTAHGLGFCAWLCVCCEIADRNARAEGFKDQADRAVNSAGFKASLARLHPSEAS